jgi:hypothetical protein
MDSNDVAFSSNLKLSLNIDQQAEPITLVLSDALEASEQPLDPSFKKRIANFVNSSSVWYAICTKRISQEASNNPATRLVRIYILSEQHDYPLVFGLLFRTELDIEHGRGFKVSEDDLSLLDYGAADIAFARDY